MPHELKMNPKIYDRSPVAVMCVVCAGPVEDHPDGRPRLYCSPRCRQSAYRARQRAERATKTATSVAG